MSKEPTILGDLPYLYAEELEGKRWTVTIAKVTHGHEFFVGGRKALGLALHFAETTKLLGVVSVTVRRQLIAATGTLKAAEMVGRKIVLYPEKSAKSPSGWAVRIAPAE